VCLCARARAAAAVLELFFFFFFFVDVFYWHKKKKKKKKKNLSQFIPIAVHLNRFYTDVARVPASHLAFAIAISRAFDVIVDPMIGAWSDNTTSRHGRRRPFIAVGAPLVALASLFLFSPPATLGPTGATVWFVVFFTLYLMVPLALPHHSLGPELTLDYHERWVMNEWGKEKKSKKKKKKKKKKKNN
jgi:Na+/melibiose symporter-like transporter